MAEKENVVWTLNGIQLSSVYIFKDYQKQGYADVTAARFVSAETEATIKCNGVEIYKGVIKECKRRKEKEYLIKVESFGDALNNIYCKSPYKGLIVPNVIIKRENPKTKEKTTIQYYLDTISVLTNKSAVTVSLLDKQGIYGSMTEVPEVGLDLPDMQIGHMKLGTALKKFICDTLGLALICDWRTSSKTRVNMIYGTYKDVKSIVLPKDFIVSTNPLDSTVVPVCDCVYVVCDDGTYGYAGAITGGVAQTTYKLDGKYSEEHLSSVAAGILKEKGNRIMSYSIEFGPGGMVQFDEGDIIHSIGDQTISDDGGGPDMEYKPGGDPENSWQCRTIEIYTDKTVVTVGQTKRTIFDIYKNILNELDGLPIETEEVVQESDEIALEPGTYDNIYGFQIEPTNAGNVSILFESEEISSTTDSNTGDITSPNGGSVTLPYQKKSKNYYDVQQNGETGISIAGNSTYSYEIPLDNVPTKYDRGEVLIQYTLGQDGAFDLTWDADLSMTTKDGNPLPDNMVESDDSDVDVSYIADYTTLIQRFYIKADPNEVAVATVFNPGTLTINLTNNLSESTIIRNIITKPSIIYYSDFPSDSTLATDTASKDPNYYYTCDSKGTIWLDYPNSDWEIPITASGDLHPNPVLFHWIKSDQNTAMERYGKAYQSSSTCWYHKTTDTLSLPNGETMEIRDDGLYEYWQHYVHDICEGNGIKSFAFAAVIQVRANLNLSRPNNASLFNYVLTIADISKVIVLRLTPTSYFKESSSYYNWRDPSYTFDIFLSLPNGKTICHLSQYDGESIIANFYYESDYCTEEEWDQVMLLPKKEIIKRITISPNNPYLDPYGFTIDKIVYATDKRGGTSVPPPDNDTERASYQVKFNSGEYSEWATFTPGQALEFSNGIDFPTDGTSLTDMATLPLSLLNCNNEINYISLQIPATCEMNITVTYEKFKNTEVFYPGVADL